MLRASASSTKLVRESCSPRAWPDHDVAPYYALFDSTNAEACEILEKGISTGDVIKADTIDDLASAMGAVALAETFASYQAFAEGSAEDEYGKSVEKAVAYGEGPYYLVSYVPSYVATMGGLKTDSDCRVVDDAGNAIEGLWAIGEITHRFMYNRSFVRHCSNSVGCQWVASRAKQLPKTSPNNEKVWRQLTVSLCLLFCVFE